MSIHFGDNKIAGEGQDPTKVNLAEPVFSGIVTAPTFVGALKGIADTATTIKNVPEYNAGGNIWLNTKVVEPTNSTKVTIVDSATSCTGNSATATKIATARTITVNGDATGSVNYDGSTNTSLVVDVVNSDTAYSFKQIASPTLTPLWNTPIGSGTITLSQSYKNFKGIWVIGGTDSQTHLCRTLLWTWELDLRRSVASASGGGWNLLDGLGGIYWGCTKESTETVFYDYAENSVIIAIYGIS